MPCFPLSRRHFFVLFTLVVTFWCTLHTCFINTGNRGIGETNSALFLYSLHFWLIYQCNHINTFISYIGLYYCNIILKELKYFSIFNYMIIVWTCYHQQYCWSDRNHSYGANHPGSMFSLFDAASSSTKFYTLHISVIRKNKCQFIITWQC